MLLTALMLALIIGFYLLFGALVLFSENVIRPRGESTQKGIPKTD